MTAHDDTGPITATHPDAPDQARPTSTTSPTSAETVDAGRPAGSGWRQRLFGVRAVLAVAVAGLVLGGLGGAALGYAGADDAQGGPGGFGGQLRGGPGGPGQLPGQGFPGQQGQGFPGQQGAGGGGDPRQSLPDPTASAS